MDPQVNNNAPPPTGGLPSRRLQVIMIGVAALIVLVVAFTPTSAPPPARSVRPATDAPTPREIEDFRGKLKAEEEHLKRAKDDADRARAAFSATTPVGAAPMPYPPAAAPTESLKTAVEQERERKEYQSLFAGNVALSLRAEGTTAIKSATPPAAASVPPAPAPAPATASDGPRKYVLFEGTVLESALTNRLNGSFTGPVNCQVTTDVWSRDHQHLLIPAGTRVLGESKRVTDQDQERLAIAFHRLIMPDGFNLNLEDYLGLDQQGATAVKDKVNHHYLAKFGTAAMLGVLAGFSVSGTGGAYNGSGVDAYRQGVANQMSQASQQVLQRQLSRLPTITIREGQRVKVYVSRDLYLPDVRDHGKEVL